MQIIHAGDVDLQVVDRGLGRPIVLVHGFPLDHSMWTAQIELLAPRYRVIAPDLRGCGGSPVTTGIVTVEQMADDMRALLDALRVDEPVVFCGLSMGGYIAFEFWRKYRQRLRGLVLCDTRSQADTPDGAQSRLKMIEHVRRAGTQYVADAMLPRLFAPETFQRNAGAVDLVRGKILAAAPEGIAATLRGLVRRRDFTAALAEIDMPTLVVVGQHDVISGVDETRSMAAAIPGAELAVIPHAGHLPPLENAEAFNGVLAQFLLRC